MFTLAPFLAGESAPALAQQVGINTAVNPDANGTPPGGVTRRLVLGQEVVHNEYIVTGPVGQTQILFLDESAMSVGPSSELTIDNFVYDPNTGNGQLAMSATKGVCRFVGGKISKLESAVTLQTPMAAIGIRGGIFLMALTPSNLDVVFLYGKGLTVTAANQTQAITRPGFFVSVAGRGAAPSAPAPAPPSKISAMLASLSGEKGATGGLSNPPTETTIANSGVANVISANVAVSVQQAAKNAPISARQPPMFDVGGAQTTYSVNTVAIQGSPIIQSADENPTPPGTLIPGTGGGSGTIPVVQFATDAQTNVTSATGIAASLNQGRLTNQNQNGGNFGSIPLPTGNATFGPQNTTSCSGCGPLTGSSFLAPDNSFLYAAFTSPTDPAGQTNFLFGGVPTVTTPTAGTGTYSGNATGAVYNNGASYQATGTFNTSYNFASGTGSFALNNFDGNNLSGSSFGSPGVNGYSAALTGGRILGAVAGSFYGTSASTTGGLFALQQSVGTPYRAFGVFGGGH
jgi:hypothetical protein